MELAINLTQSEKRTFIRFLSLYLSASFVLMIFIALLYYQNEKKLYFDLTKTKMQNVASNISSQIIFSHMRDKKLDMKQFVKTDLYQISFYDENKEKMYGNLDEKIDFSKKIIEKEKYFILVDSSSYGHLGVEYIAIKENVYFKNLERLQKQITIIFLIIYSLLSLVGFFLAKLFLKPKNTIASSPIG